MLIERTALEVARSAAKEGTERYAFHAVQIDDQGRITATDGHHFIRLAALVTNPDMFVLDELAALNVLRAEHVTLPADVVLAFATACKRRRKKKDEPGNDHVLVHTNDEGSTLATVDGRTKRHFEFKPADLTFPDVTRVAKTGKPTLSVALSVELLTKVLRTLKAVGAGSIRLKLFTALDPILIEADTVTGKLDGAIMPMRLFSPDDTDREPPSADPKFPELEAAPDEPLATDQPANPPDPPADGPEPARRVPKRHADGKKPQGRRALALVGKRPASKGGRKR